MKGREAKLKGPPSADLLVCFPSRSHLALMPKAICSPARSAELNKHHRRHLKRSSTMVQASPLAWAKTKPMGSEVSEPTSPKVTCAGQIKIRHKATRSCKSWQSVMEEIERIRHRKHEKRSGWADGLRFKKEVMQFLTFLRNIRLDFRCFGAFPESDITSDDGDNQEDGERENYRSGADGTKEAPGTVFSKWFMVLQENQDSEFFKSDNSKEEKKRFSNDNSVDPPAAPPPNALLLMRCRSAPVKSWLKEKDYHGQVQEEEEEEDDAHEEDEDDGKKDKRKSKQLMLLMEEEKRKDEEEKRKKENLVVMKYDTDFAKISKNIANETWVLGGNGDPFSRSRSWKR